MAGHARTSAGGPSLFDPPELSDSAADPASPLAVRMRPRELAELVGQADLVATGSPLRRLVEGTGAPSSVILWGPPGTGKTTIASLVSRAAGRRFAELSAVTAGVKEVRAAIDTARMSATPTVLFIDEFHRFTRTQQDALLPGVENGWVTLVAATTENPSFAVTSPLLSRSLLLTLRPLQDDDIVVLLDRAVADDRGLAGRVRLADDARADLVRFAGGDARRALTYLEAATAAALDEAATAAVPDDATAVPDEAATAAVPDDATAAVPDDATAVPDEAATAAALDEAATAAVPDDATAVPDDATAVPDDAHAPLVTVEHVATAVQRALVRYDRTGDQHYDVISAFIKSVRGSDVDAALHYLARMIEAGEDPRFVARRLVILASEDVGMAEPSALGVATAAMTAAAQIGLPEARLALAQATIHLSLAPKSNAVIRAIDAAQADVRSGQVGQVPAHLRDAHYPGAQSLGVRGYVYPHADPTGVVPQQYAPDPVVGRRYYEPTDHGTEQRLAVTVQRLRAVLAGSESAAQQPPGRQ